MRTVFLLRHAKAVPGDAAGTRDFDRELSKRGAEEALRAGEAMNERNIRPQLILSSPAMRTRQTIELAIQSLELKAEPQFDERVYGASLSELLSVVATVDKAVKSLLLVGHNPGMEELLRYLTGEVRPLATAALARIDMENCSWNELTRRGGRLAWIIKNN